MDINFRPDIYYLYSIDANGCCVEQEPHQISVSQLESDFNYFDSDTWIECDGDNSGKIHMEVRHLTLTYGHMMELIFRIIYFNYLIIGTFTKLW